MDQAGTPSPSMPDAPGSTPPKVYTVEYWLATQFDLKNYQHPLVGFLSLEGMTNLQVLARLVSLNGGSKVEGWGKVSWDATAPYKFRGLANADEAMLLNAMLNFAAGMVASLGEDASRVMDIVGAQITLDAGQVIKH